MNAKYKFVLVLGLMLAIIILPHEFEVKKTEIIFSERVNIHDQQQMDMVYRELDIITANMPYHLEEKRREKFKNCIESEDTCHFFIADTYGNRYSFTFLKPDFSIQFPENYCEEFECEGLPYLSVIE